MLQKQIESASKEELTLMLYEGGIKFLNQAIIALEKNDIVKANNLILRTEDIVREFQLTLDHKYAEISKPLDQLYDYMHRRLVEGNLQKDVEILNEVLGMFREMRDTWKEAMKLAKAAA
ncbi:MAG: flagellar export chaperone FliS [Defluviitaleaceae bacterium]|nr:flagellar export chaperone FliS [Defluviitaleaceae bacterium]MCL2263119.1 flagellar export chaperone FliS [Defluviitaleaceae bacterium]